MTKATYTLLDDSGGDVRVEVGDVLIGWVYRTSEAPGAEGWAWQSPGSLVTGRLASRDDAVRCLIAAKLERQKRKSIPEDTVP